MRRTAQKTAILTSGAGSEGHHDAVHLIRREIIPLEKVETSSSRFCQLLHCAFHCPDVVPHAKVGIRHNQSNRQISLLFLVVMVRTGIVFPPCRQPGRARRKVGRRGGHTQPRRPRSRHHGNHKQENHDSRDAAWPKNHSPNNQALVVSDTIPKIGPRNIKFTN